MPKKKVVENMNVKQIVLDVSVEDTAKLLKSVQEDSMKEIENLKADYVAFIKSLKEEYDTLLALAGTYNPKHNEKAISIVQQPDGNWVGEANKFGNVVSVRQGDPQVVLQLLLTHDGK